MTALFLPLPRKTRLKRIFCVQPFFSWDRNRAVPHYWDEESIKRHRRVFFFVPLCTSASCYPQNLDVGASEKRSWEVLPAPSELDICRWAARGLVRGTLETTLLVEWALAWRSLTFTHKQVQYLIFDIASAVSITLLSHLRLYTWKFWEQMAMLFFPPHLNIVLEDLALFLKIPFLYVYTKYTLLLWYSWQKVSRIGQILNLGQLKEV